MYDNVNDMLFVNCNMLLNRSGLDLILETEKRKPFYLPLLNYLINLQFTGYMSFIYIDKIFS